MKVYNNIRIKEEITLRDFLIEMVREKPNTMGSVTVIFTDEDYKHHVFKIDYRFSKIESFIEFDNLLSRTVKYASVTHDVFTICENYIVELRD